MSVAGLAGFVLSLEKQSGLAAILARSPQVSLLGVGQTKVAVAGAAPPAKIVAEGAPVPVIKGSFAPLSLLPFKVGTTPVSAKNLPTRV